MAGTANRTRRNVRHSPDGVGPALRASRRFNCPLAGIIRHKISPSRHFAGALLIFQRPFLLSGVNLLKLLTQAAVEGTERTRINDCASRARTTTAITAKLTATIILFMILTLRWTAWFVQKIWRHPLTLTLFHGEREQPLRGTSCPRIHPAY